jgi:hypothetical protein
VPRQQRLQLPGLVAGQQVGVDAQRDLGRLLVPDVGEPLDVERGDLGPRAGR